MAPILFEYITRTMQPTDIDGIMQVQQAVYPRTLLEEPAFFLNRMQLAGPLCRVAVDGEEVLGYLTSYPWHSGLPPELNLPLTGLPADAGCWFIHDCAVLPKAQGRGVAGRLLGDAALAAKQIGLRTASLVALADAVAYWQQRDFLAQPVPAAALAGYGDGAQFMLRGDIGC